MILAESYCSGIGAPEVAKPNWNWQLAAEVAAFPREILSCRFAYADIRHFPNASAKLWSDLAALRVRHYRKYGLALPDVIVAGTPCQAFSLAGLRKGLNDARGNLTLSFVHHVRSIANAARHAGKPGPVIAWENVPGVLSHETNPFGCFLSGLVGADDPLLPPRGENWPSAGMVSGPWSRVAWRVLDAQYFGLAQRRARVILIADFGNRADPAKILFERRSMRGNPETGRKARKDIAGSLTARARGGGGLGTDFECQGGLIPEKAWALQERDAKRPDSSTKEGRLIPIAFTSKDYGADAGALSPTLRAMPHDKSHPNAGGQVGVAYAIQERAVSENPNAGPDGAGFRSDDKAYTLEARQRPQAVAMNIRGREGGAMPEIDNKASLRAADGGSSRSYVATEWAVRRLTPVECARLQGFPDHHTQIAWRGRDPVDCPDGPQYMGYGNAMPVPLIKWVLDGIELELTRR